MPEPTYAIIELTCLRCKEKITKSTATAEEYTVLCRDGIEVPLPLREAIIFQCAVSGNMSRDHIIFEIWAARGLEEPQSASNMVSLGLIELNKRLARLNLRLCRIKGYRHKYIFIDLKDTPASIFIEPRSGVDISELLTFNLLN